MKLLHLFEPTERRVGKSDTDLIKESAKVVVPRRCLGLDRLFEIRDKLAIESVVVRQLAEARGQLGTFDLELSVLRYHLKRPNLVTESLGMLLSESHLGSEFSGAAYD